MKKQAWKIYRNGRYIDTVFYDLDCSMEYVIAAENCDEAIKTN